MIAFLLAAVVAASRGPSSSAGPYVVPVAPNALTISLLTVGDSVNAKPDGKPYRLVGFTDGMGAYDNGDGTFTLLVNHEVDAAAGFPHAHGTVGAFVSKWTIRKSDLRVLRGEDLIQQVVVWNRLTNRYDLPAKGVPLSRFCSATLMRDLGLYLNGEETFNGRVFAHSLDGTSYELPRFGRAQWENAVMNPVAQRTIVVGLDDFDGGFMYVYVGQKQATGTIIDRAGLTSGAQYVIQVVGRAAESPQAGIPSGSAFHLLNLTNVGNVENMDGGTQRNAAAAMGATRFLRPEDGAWDPNHPRDFYFATTGPAGGRSRLWRLRFNSLDDPVSGGTLDMLLDGTEGPQMMDNLTVRTSGDVIIQEDVGGARLAKIWRYDPATDRVDVIAEHDFNLFTPGVPGAISINEESSGIIDVADILGEGWLLFDVQAHAPADAETLERGQLLAMRYPVMRRHSARH